MILLLALLVQDDLRVLTPEDKPGTMLYDYLRAECQRAFDARRKAVAELKTPEDVRRRQAMLKEKFIAALGGFPEKTPLNPKSTGTLQGGGFTVEKVIYESRPDHHVTAAFYLPEGKGPFPGVLVPCGHSENGKAAEAYQRACILMAKNGLAVLCYDPIGQGERKQLLDDKGQPAIKGSTTEHTAAGIGALLVGRSAATYRIWDGIRSLDYLASRSEVDPKKLGCAGNSGGGTLTAYLMALDERIVAAAPACYITTLERLFATIGPQDAEQNIPGQVAFGMEHTDYVTMRAPLPTLINIGSQDYFDQEGSWTTYREAKQVYGLLGHGERVDLFEFNDKHGWSLPRRESALRWMRRWLLAKDDARVETDFPIFKDAELQCTKSGQVLLDFKGKSVFDLNLEREKELLEGQSGLPRVGDRIMTVRGIPLEWLPRGTIWLPSRGNIVREGYAIAKRVARISDGLLLPGLVYTPDAPSEVDVFFVHGEGKAKEAGPGGRLETWAKGGVRVTAIDLRGMGETTPVGKSSGYGREEQAAFLALHLNYPLLDQRVEDIMVWRGQLNKETVHLVAVGSAGPAALHAAWRDPSITRVTIEGALLSWSSVLRAPASKGHLANVVPGALAFYDLPDLAKSIAPRRLVIKNPVDAAGNPVSQAELERVFAPVRLAYQKKSSEQNLILEGKK